MTYKVLLVDDEPLARKRLGRLLEPHADVQVVGEAASVEEARDLVERLAPNLLLLDIELGDGTAFDLVRGVADPPAVVFVTGHDQYALQAFAAAGIDYLLKPVESGDRDRALRRVRRVAGPTAVELERRLQALLDRYQRGDSEYLQKIAVRLGERTLLVDLTQVTHFSAKDKYVFLYTVAGKEQIVDQTIVELESRLDPRRFVRVHRATIVNIDHIQEIQVWFGGKYRLVVGDKNPIELTVSKGMAHNLKALVPF